MLKGLLVTLLSAAMVAVAPVSASAATSAMSDYYTDNYGNYWMNYRYYSVTELIDMSDAAANYDTGLPVEIYGILYSTSWYTNSTCYRYIVNYDTWDDFIAETNGETQYIDVYVNEYNEEWPGQVFEGDAVHMRGVYFGKVTDEAYEGSLAGVPVICGTKAVALPTDGTAVTVNEGNAALYEEAREWDRMYGIDL